MIRSVGLLLGLLFTGFQDSADKVKALIEKLGSEELPVRDEAAKELIRLGYDVLPALRQAAAGSSGTKKELIEPLIGRIQAFGAPVFVTLEQKDRPLRDVVADLQRQTRITFKLVGAIGDVKVTAPAGNTVVWKVVEDICRAHGHLMYRFDKSGIEIYPSKFRNLPVADQEGFRFFIDRFIWEGGPQGGHFRMLSGVLAPPDAQVILIEHRVEHILDDQGIDLMELPQGWRWGFSDDHHQQYPNPRKFLYPFGYLPDSRRVPAAKATKIARCSGKIVVWLAQGGRVLTRLPGPIEKPSIPAPDKVPALGITKWRFAEGRVEMRVTAAWDKPSVSFLSERLSPTVKLKLKDGSWIPSAGFHSFPGVSPNEIKREDDIVAFEVPRGAQVESLDLVAPDPVLKVELPFDFRDIALSAKSEQQDRKNAAEVADDRVNCRWRKVIDFTGTPTWTAIMTFSKKDWPEKDAVLRKDLQVIEAKMEGDRALALAPPEDTALPGFDFVSPSGAPGPLEVAVEIPYGGERTISKLRLSMVARVPRGRRHYLLSEFDSPEKMKVEDELFEVRMRAPDEWGGGSPELEVRPKETPHSDLAGIWCTLLYKFDTIYAPGAGELIFTGRGESTTKHLPYGSLLPTVAQGKDKVRQLLKIEVIIPVGIEDRPVTLEYRHLRLR